MMESQAKFLLAPAIVALVVAASGCGSSGPAGGGADPGRFAACLPSCIADAIAWCPIPAGACTSESISARETSSCYSGGIKTLVYSDAGAEVLTASGPCPYQTYRAYTAVNNLPRLESILYANGANAPYGCISMDDTDPNNRKGTARCGIDCQEATGSTDPGQPFDFDNPACSFFQVQYGASWTITDGLPYDDPHQVCAQGATGSCPAPP